MLISNDQTEHLNLAKNNLKMFTLPIAIDVLSAAGIYPIHLSLSDF